MLDAACQQTLALDYGWLPQLVDASCSDVLRPLQRVPQPWNRQASFLVFLLPLGGLDDGIDKMPDLAIDVVGENAAAHTDLVSRQARTPRRGNGLLQIGHQADEHVIERVDGITRSSKHRITEQTDRTLSHRAILPGGRALRTWPTHYRRVPPRCPRTAIKSQRSPPAAPCEYEASAGFEPASNAP